MHQYVNSSNEMLRKRGYRLTPQRFMILSVIQEAEEHLSIDQITERVQKRNPYVSLSTIYRTLELLRHHLVCRNCRAIIHLDNALLGNLNEHLQEQYHFYNLTLDLVASGYCDDCWKIIQSEPSEKQA